MKRTKLSIQTASFLEETALNLFLRDLPVDCVRDIKPVPFKDASGLDRTEYMVIYLVEVETE